MKTITHLKTNMSPEKIVVKPAFSRKLWIPRLFVLTKPRKTGSNSQDGPQMWRALFTLAVQLGVSAPVFFFCCFFWLVLLLMVQKSQGQPPGMVLKPCKSWDIYYIGWLAGFLPSTVLSQKNISTGPKECR